MGEICGYGRVSSVGQTLDVQIDKLRAAGCTKLFLEKVSGAQAANRRELQKAIEFVREGDTFVVTKLDRLARSVLDLHRIIDLLQRKNVAFLCTDQQIDTARPEGRLTLSLLAAVASFERDILRERQADGIAKAKAKGVQFGRKPALTEEQRRKIQRMREQEAFSAQQLADRFHVGIATIYRVLQPLDAS